MPEVSPLTAWPRPGGAGPRRIVALIVAASFLVSACSGSEPTEAEARRARVEDRLEATFSRAQVDCLLDRLDGPALATLDRARDVDIDSPALASYSEALVSCVADPDGTTSTTAAPAANTTEAQASTTAG